MKSKVKLSDMAACLMALIFFAVTSSSYAESENANPAGPRGGKGAGPKGSIREKAVVDQEWEKKADLNKDGIVDKFEFDRWKGRGQGSGNNPPEPAGSQETSMENTEGPAGGSGVIQESNLEDKAVVNKRWEKRADANKDGVVDETEINQWKNRPRGDRDNNPPGPKGGEGTNWENPAGPAGGPCASPDRRAGVNPPGPRGGPGAGPRFDKDGNPPGPRGGEGTNWENPAGPVGGPGASPDRRAGVNPPGPRGGPGAGPDAGNVKARSVVDKKWEAKADKNKDGVVGKVEANKSKAAKAVAKPKASKSKK